VNPPACVSERFPQRLGGPVVSHKPGNHQRGRSVDWPDRRGRAEDTPHPRQQPGRLAETKGKARRRVIAGETRLPHPHVLSLSKDCLSLASEEQGQDFDKLSPNGV
jgi:hypothetical protein